MKKQTIESLLKSALINNGRMEYALYEYELEEMIVDMKISMSDDNDDFIFAVTEYNHDVAMVLIEKRGTVYINELARDRLRSLWKGAYIKNMQKLIPFFAQQLNDGEIPINGVKIARQFNA